MYRLKQLTILIIDLLVLYVGFFITLLVRHGIETNHESFTGLLPHISILYFIAIVLLFIIGLYDLTNNKNTFTFYRKLSSVAVLWAIMSVIYFYLNPAVAVTPKTILLLNTLIGFSLLALWRYLHNRFLSISLWKYTVVFAGVTPEAQELITILSDEPERGFKVLGVVDPTPPSAAIASSISFFSSLTALKNTSEKSINLIVIAPHLSQNEELLKELYTFIFDQIEMVTLAEFYERITGRIPPFTFSESWFLTHLREQQKKIYDRFRILIDYLCAVFIALFFICTFPVIALLIKTTSSGPLFFRQHRVGRQGKVFTLIKYRSMKALNKDGSAEIAGAQFTEKNDPRITSIGKILRKIRLDEVPQCINIFKGQMGIIGPRPERPEFVEPLTKAIPFYTLRHLVKPGLTGWASISESYYGTIDENLRKLQYDLYYVKNRGPLLDMVILLKTLSIMIGMRGR
jgi:exopolysaccharide biosynthesis polyprenyl glycosylphosphotransferase